jgi:hypothetical protein
MVVLLKKVHSKSIGLFLGKVRKMTSKDTEWEKVEKKNMITGTVRTYYKVTVPSLKARFTVELIESGGVVQIPTDVYLRYRKGAKRLEAIFNSFETGNKEYLKKYE